MGTYINVNGKLLPSTEAVLKADNRAFRYGYGLFETMLVKDCNIRLGAYHWERLFDGIALLRISTSKFFRDELERELMRTVRKNKMEALCRVRLQVFAGNGGLYDENPSFGSEYVIETFSIEESSITLNETGLTVGIADCIKSTGPYSHIKASAALQYALAARQAKDARWNDALLLNERGTIVESTIANIFWVENGTIYTPPIKEGCVDGIMRRHLLSHLPLLGYIVKELPFKKESLRRANELFLTNAIKGIRWVGAVGDNTYETSLAKELYTKVIKQL